MVARDHPIRGGVESTKITAAEEALKNLPKDKEQEALKERLDAVNPIEITENGGNP